MANSAMPALGTKKNCRTSRKKKQYWRKAMQEANEFISHGRFGIKEDTSIKQESGNFCSIGQASDSKLGNLTRRQRAALQKRLNMMKLCRREENTELVKSSKLQCKRTFPRKQRTKVHDAKPATVPTKTCEPETYDLWGSKDIMAQETSFLEEYYLRATKKKLPKEPKTLKHITSILPSVEIADSGASYNPSLPNYLDYVNELATEERIHERNSEKVERSLALAPGETYITQEEKLIESSAGLFLENDNDEDAEDPDESLAYFFFGGKHEITSVKPKSRKMRRLEAIRRKQKLEEENSKNEKDQLHLVYAVRRLRKEIDNDIRKQEEAAVRRSKKKLAKRFVATQRLGRGKFETFEKPFLLTEELPRSLRELKPQGSIILERLKSLQKRNILPVPGEKKKKSKLKTKLRFKKVEKRKFKEVTVGSRVI